MKTSIHKKCRKIKNRNKRKICIVASCSCQTVKKNFEDMKNNLLSAETDCQSAFKYYVATCYVDVVFQTFSSFYLLLSCAQLDNEKIKFQQNCPIPESPVKIPVWNGTGQDLENLKVLGPKSPATTFSSNFFTCHHIYKIAMR